MTHDRIRNERGEDMHTSLNGIIEEMQQHAKVCETVALDKTQDALSGASNEKDKNTQEAKDWMIKSTVWIEAEAIVRKYLSGQEDQRMGSPVGLAQHGTGESLK